MIIYIQRRGDGYLETVDEVEESSRRETRRVANRYLAEYRMGDPSAVYYLSSRPCKAWKERQ